jgi:dihydrofolate reductase
MRKLILSVATMSLDGFLAEQDTEFWHRFGPFTMVDDDAYDEFGIGAISHAGLHLMGRVTYEGMADYWPTATGPIAAIMNDIPKVVFSKTLTKTRWPEARIASGDLVEELAALKAEPGGAMIAHGGVTFLQALVRTGLVDEYWLSLYPVVVGGGRGLFADLEHPLGLSVLSSRLFANGVTVQRFRPLTTQELAARPGGPGAALDEE